MPTLTPRSLWGGCARRPPLAPRRRAPAAATHARLPVGERLNAPYPGSTPRALEVRFGNGSPRALALGPQAPIAALTGTDSGAGTVVHRSGEKGPVLVRLETTYLPAGDGAQEGGRTGGSGA